MMTDNRMPPVLRSYTPDVDLPRLARLLTEVEGVDRDGENTTEAALRDQLAWMDPARDCWVVESHDDADGLIGYGSAFAQTPRRSTLYVAVHPLWRNRGLGGALLDRALSRARDVTVYANERNAASNDFLRRHGFEAAGSAWIMRASADTPIQEARWPDGYSARSFAEVNHVPTLVEAHNRSYHDMWGHAENERPATEESMVCD